MATDDVDGLHRIAMKLFDLFHIGICYILTLSLCLDGGCPTCMHVQLLGLVIACFCPESMSYFLGLLFILYPS